MTRSLLYFILALAVATLVADMVFVVQPTSTKGEGFSGSQISSAFVSIGYGLAVFFFQRSIVNGMPFLSKDKRILIWWIPAILGYSGALVSGLPLILIFLLGLPYSLVGLVFLLLALVIWK